MERSQNVSKKWTGESGLNTKQNNIMRTGVIVVVNDTCNVPNFRHMFYMKNVWHFSWISTHFGCTVLLEYFWRLYFNVNNIFMTDCFSLLENRPDKMMHDASFGYSTTQPKIFDGFSQKELWCTTIVNQDNDDAEQNRSKPICDSVFKPARQYQ